MTLTAPSLVLFHPSVDLSYVKCPGGKLKEKLSTEKRSMINKQGKSVGDEESSQVKNYK